MALPSGYKQLEYIQSSGTQYIDTGVDPTSQVDVEVDFQLLATSTAWACILGGRDASGNNNTIGVWHDSKVFYFYRGSNNTRAGFPSSVSALTRHYFSSKGNTADIDGTQISLAAQTFTGTNNMYLFSMNNGGTPSNSSQCNLYSCKIYNAGTLIRDFVPAQRTSDNAIGLYDQKNGVFYTNAGSGVFAAGPYVGPTGHQSNIDAVDYEITDGDSMVGGASYSVAGGKTMIDGAVYAISFAPEIVSVNIIGSGIAKVMSSNEECAYVVIGGNKYISATTIEVPVGTSCECYLRGWSDLTAYGDSGLRGVVRLNGVAKANSDRYAMQKMYTHTITKPTSIEFKTWVISDGDVDAGVGDIYITE